MERNEKPAAGGIFHYSSNQQRISAEEDNNILSEEAVRLQLKNTEVLVEVWKEIASTNQRMKQLAVEKRLPHGSVVVAQLQTEGKGRKGRKFYSPKDSGLSKYCLCPKKQLRKAWKLQQQRL